MASIRAVDSRLEATRSSSSNRRAHDIPADRCTPAGDAQGSRARIVVQLAVEIVDVGVEVADGAALKRGDVIVGIVLMDIAGGENPIGPGVASVE